MRESTDSPRSVGGKVEVAEKAQEAHAAFEREWRGNPISFERGGTRLELREKPVLRMKGDLVVGVSYYDVHLYGADGKEVPIDPTRHIINHPQYPRSSLSYVEETDPQTGFITMRRVLGNANVLEAGWEAVGDSVLVAPNPHRFGTRGTVTTVFATAPGGAGCVVSVDSNYATARTAATGDFGDANHIVGQNFVSGVYRLSQSHVIFDTSGLPDTDTVSNVVATFDGQNDSSTTDCTVNIGVSSTYDGGAVVAGDWMVIADITALTVLATFNTTGYSSGANVFTSAGAPFNSAINKTGNTVLVLYSNRFAAGTTPTGAEQVTFVDADAAGTTTDPVLDITHAAPGANTYPGWNQTRGGWW